MRLCAASLATRWDVFLLLLRHSRGFIHRVGLSAAAVQSARCRLLADAARRVKSLSATYAGEALAAAPAD
jgi:hypothetical protein